MGSRMGIGRMGFEYCYWFCIDDENVQQWEYSYLDIDNENTRYVFETRTQFIVKGKLDDIHDDEKLIDSETFATKLLDDWVGGYDRFEMSIGRRLKDYWMSDDEIHELADSVFTFAKKHDMQCAGPDNKQPLVVIVINIRVCTVQQEGEPIDATMDRAITPQYLYPISRCPWYQYSRPRRTLDKKEEDHQLIVDLMPHMLYLRDELHKIRVDDVDKGHSLMEECPICLRNPTVGAQISLLNCRHAFHHHCIVRWLLGQNSCPMCRQQAHEEEKRCYNDDFISKFFSCGYDY